MSGGRCAARYPILLIHGTGFRDSGPVGYWGRIPDALEREGAKVFLGGQESWATVEENGGMLLTRAQEVLEETGAEKLHLIAHSKGGLEARWLAARPELAGRVASVTTVSTPHHGSRTMDAIQRLPKFCLPLAGFFVNRWYRLLGEKNPDFLRVCGQFTTAWAEDFNRRTPDADGVFYRSYAGAMKGVFSDVFMWWEYLVIRLVEGENDGLVTVESARWTNFRGTWRGVGRRGVSHLDEVDFRRRSLSKKPKGEGVADMAEEYVAMVAELKDLGL